MDLVCFQYPFSGVWTHAPWVDTHASGVLHLQDCYICSSNRGGRHSCREEDTNIIIIGIVPKYHRQNHFLVLKQGV